MYIINTISKMRSSAMNHIIKDESADVIIIQHNFKRLKDLWSTLMGSRDIC